MPARKYAELCETPRYVPAGASVNIWPAGSPRWASCPIKIDLTAVAVIRLGVVRWYGVRRAYINSRLRVVVQGYPHQFREIMGWPIVPRKDRIDEQR